MKIDMHMHSMERSRCSVSSEKNQIEAAIRFGLDAIVLTDHDVCVPEEHVKKLCEKYAPFKIFSGIEVRVTNRGDDVLVLGVHNDELMSRTWSYEEIHKFVRARNGYIALCHPFRYSNSVDIDIQHYVPDAIEAHSTNIGICDEEKITRLANGLGVNVIANSDAHYYEHIGIYCNNLYADTVTDEDELIFLLKTGKYSISCDAERIEKFNIEVRKREALIKEIISTGGTAEDYYRITGNWTGQFDRVAMGRSYEI